MKGETLLSLGLAFIGLATVAVIVQSPQTSNVFKSGGAVFIGSIRAAMGK